MNDHRHVLVVSHRRSGTHLTIDTLRNNFPALAGPHINIEQALPRHPNHVPLATIENQLREAPCLIKTHTHRDWHTYFDGVESVLRLFATLVRNAAVIYVYRDGRDVMRSLYHYMLSFDSSIASQAFPTFIRGQKSQDLAPTATAFSRPAYWAHHVAGWIDEPDVLALAYEDLINDFDPTLDQLARHIAHDPVPERVNVVRSTLPQASVSIVHRIREKVYKLVQQYVHGIELTSVLFQGGGYGKYHETFSEDDLVYFQEEAGHVMTRLGYPTSTPA